MARNASAGVSKRRHPRATQSASGDALAGAIGAKGAVEGAAGGAGGEGPGAPLGGTVQPSEAVRTSRANAGRIEGVNLMEARHSSAASAPGEALLPGGSMPHHRTRAMIVSRGVQPAGPDRRLPTNPAPPPAIPSPAVNIAIPPAPPVNVDADVGVNAGDDDPSRPR